MVENWLFPYKKNVSHNQKDYDAQYLIDKLSSYLTENRVQKIKEISSQRSFHLQVLLENIYDTGNINAVMRTSENFGYSAMHIIESKRTMISHRTTRGAHKWLSINKWNNVSECVTSLKASGFQVVTTALTEKAIPMTEVDFSKPTLLALGNEKDGISPELNQLADINCVIPTVGFSQSFNISVAASILLSHIYFKYKLQNVSPSEHAILMAHYLLTSVKSSLKDQEKINMILERKDG